MNNKEDFETTKRKSQLNAVSHMNYINREVQNTIKVYIRKYFLSDIAKAMVYLGLESPDATELLNDMDEEIKTTILDQAEQFDKNDQEVIDEVEHILNSTGMDLSTDYMVLASTLTRCGKEFSENALKMFKEENPIFIKKIDSYIFDFSEIKYIDDRSMLKIIDLIDQVTLATALKGTYPEIQKKFFNCLSTHNADMLKEDMEFMGPVSASSVEECQTKIMQLVFSLAASGEITLPEKYGEDEVVK